eukprot:Lankesteria_metandrocarpae@DN4974_c0_g1_i6.p2
MCGRTACTLHPNFVRRIGKANKRHCNLSRYWPKYNMTPMSWNPIVIEKPQQHGHTSPTETEIVVHRVVCAGRWGVVPAFTKPEDFTKAQTSAASMINARSEGVQTSRVYRRLIDRHRCVVFVDGFFEWRTNASSESASASNKKQVYFFTSQENETQIAFGVPRSDHEESHGVAVDIQATSEECTVRQCGVKRCHHATQDDEIALHLKVKRQKVSYGQAAIANSDDGSTKCQGVPQKHEQRSYPEPSPVACSSAIDGRAITEGTAVGVCPKNEDDVSWDGNDAADDTTKGEGETGIGVMGNEILDIGAEDELESIFVGSEGGQAQLFCFRLYLRTHSVFCTVQVLVGSNTIPVMY